MPHFYTWRRLSELFNGKRRFLFRKTMGYALEFNVLVWRGYPHRVFDALKSFDKRQK